MPSRVPASPFINSNSGQEMLCCTLPPLPWARFEFEHKTNIQESLTAESVRDAVIEKSWLRALFTAIRIHQEVSWYAFAIYDSKSK